MDALGGLGGAVVHHGADGDGVLVLLVPAGVELHVVGDRPVHELVQRLGAAGIILS